MPCSPACISLGGNLGTVPAAIAGSLKELDQRAGVRVVRVSRNYLTDPVGSEAGAPYVNAVAKLETTLTPKMLLRQLQQVEQQFGRVRTVRWGPRTLDLDLILFGDKVIQTANLVVPHPAAWYRRFVLVPLAEIAPETWHPVKQVPISELLRLTMADPYRVLVVGSPARVQVALAVAEEFSQACSQVEVQPVYSVEEMKRQHSILWYLEENKTVPFEACPLLTRLNLATQPDAGLPQYLHDLLTACLGSVHQEEPS